WSSSAARASATFFHRGTGGKMEGDARAEASGPIGGRSGWSDRAGCPAALAERLPGALGTFFRGRCAAELPLHLLSPAKIETELGHKLRRLPDTGPRREWRGP